MAGIERAQRLVYGLAPSKITGQIDLSGELERLDRHFHDPAALPSGEVEARVDGQSIEPGVETLGVAQAPDVAPSSDEGLLDRVARKLAVTKDQSGCCVQARKRRIEKRSEGVMIASLRPLDQGLLVHSCLGWGAAFQSHSSA